MRKGTKPTTKNSTTDAEMSRSERHAIREREVAEKRAEELALQNQILRLELADAKAAADKNKDKEQPKVDDAAVAAAKAAAAAAQEENKKLREQLASQKEEIQKLRAQADQDDDEVHELKDKLDAVTQELEEQKLAGQESEASAKAGEEKIADLRAKLAAMETAAKASAAAVRKAEKDSAASKAKAAAAKTTAASNKEVAAGAASGPARSRKRKLEDDDDDEDGDVTTTVVTPSRKKAKKSSDKEMTVGKLKYMTGMMDDNVKDWLETVLEGVDDAETTAKGVPTSELWRSAELRNSLNACMKKWDITEKVVSDAEEGVKPILIPGDVYAKDVCQFYDTAFCEGAVKEALLLMRYTTLCRVKESKLSKKKKAVYEGRNCSVPLCPSLHDTSAAQMYVCDVCGLGVCQDCSLLKDGATVEENEVFRCFGCLREPMPADKVAAGGVELPKSKMLATAGINRRIKAMALPITEAVIERLAHFGKNVAARLAEAKRIFAEALADPDGFAKRHGDEEQEEEDDVIDEEHGGAAAVAEADGDAVSDDGHVLE